MHLTAWVLYVSLGQVYKWESVTSFASFLSSHHFLGGFGFHLLHSCPEIVFQRCILRAPGKNLISCKTIQMDLFTYYAGGSLT